ncbi:MAG: 4a-hydroxytetrahydrobiopterin dehydratase [Akkermansiaceae bacterium]|jgi:4a-hydroxytetrahydrobiopterin dehydratase
MIVLMGKLLTSEEVARGLEALDSWEIVESELIKVFKFGDYLEGIEFAGQCGKIAEEMNHHPDLLIQWRKVTVSISTHSAGGLTALDFDFANKIEG